MFVSLFFLRAPALGGGSGAMAIAIEQVFHRG
jgi:hypothetical protein